MLSPDDYRRVAQTALLQIRSLLEEWFPKGVYSPDKKEFCIGSVSGEAGKSMRIHVADTERKGYWSDFEAGESGLDLISLFAYKEGLTNGKACYQLARKLGVELSRDESSGPPASSNPSKPKARQKPAPAQAAQVVDDPTKKKKAEWVPVLPVPEDAGPYPVAHPVRGRAERFWVYRDQERRLLGVIYRFVTSSGDKEVLPCVYARNSVTGKGEWKWRAFPEPRPLYLPAPLRTGMDVLLVEGEKCADVAHDYLFDLVDVASWPGGCKAPKKCDWMQLAGRRVLMWADCDAKTYKENQPLAGQIKPEDEQPGMSAMADIRDILVELGCEVRFIDIPAAGEKPDGWDIADLVDEGASPEDVAAWLQRLRPVPVEYSAKDEMDAAGEPEGDIPDYVTAPPEEASAERPAGAALEWKQIRSMMIETANGGVKGCRENVYMALQHDVRLMGVVALDQFSQLQVKRKKTPWPSEPGEWTEADDFHLGMYLAKTYRLVMASTGEIEKAVAQAAREHAFNPVTEFLDRCAQKYDGKLRVVNAFRDYWGAKDSEYMQLVSLMFFVGLAKRAYCPGIKHDHAPVFEGGQGKGKSTALSILGGQWFADTPFKMGEKDGFLSIQGVLIYEIAELEQFNRSEVTAIKAFMSSQTDRYREPYGRRMKSVPRRTVFAGTTNENEYFKDTTGNRRFWPVETGQIDLEGLRRDLEQLLGEAVHLMRGGELWYPTPEEQARLISPEQEKREIADPWLGRIYDYVEGKNMDGDKVDIKLDKVTCRELLTKALHIEIGKLGPAKQETMRIAACMRKLGWLKDRETEGARERFYQRPEPGPREQVAAVASQQEEEDDEPLPI